MIGKIGVAAMASTLAVSAPAAAIEAATRSGLSAAQMFEIAGQAVGDADNAAAITIYEALARDPDIDVRCEARYRHGQLLVFGKNYLEAAVLFRAILDEKPDAGRVRLELAGVLMAMGEDSGARRELRQAQAGGLPPDVVRVVDQFQGALRANQPIGGSLEIALAPSTNINRATSATTVDTVIARFDLSKDAQAQSGLGGRIGGQGYLRLPVTDGLRWTLRGSGQGVFYRKSQFNDVAVAAETGLELTTGRSRLQPSIGRIWRWFGGEVFTVSNTANLSWLRRIGARSQLDASIGYGRNDFRLNDLQDGNSYDASADWNTRSIHAAAGGSAFRRSDRRRATRALPPAAAAAMRYIGARSARRRCLRPLGFPILSAMNGWRCFRSVGSNGWRAPGLRRRWPIDGARLCAARPHQFRTQLVSRGDL
jgi:hypothetical protein